MRTNMTIMKKLGGMLVAVVLGIASLAAQGGVTYFHNDIAGSPVAATNEAGAVVWRESYRPYGERRINSASASDNKVWFTSRRQDVDTGLVYMGARYYDPVVGRFISMDPAGFDEGNLHSHNRYAYANNNPYKYVDPGGRSGQAIAIGAGLGAVALMMIPEERRRELGESLRAGVLGLYNIYNQGAEEGAKKPGKQQDGAQSAKSPEISPSDVAGKSPQDIDKLAREKGLQPKGPDPSAGRGAYVDPVTGEQRILVHPGAKGGSHAHVNDAAGRRLDIGGNVVAPESPGAHLPLTTP